MVKALGCRPGAGTLLFNVCFLVLGAQQAQPSSVEPPEGNALQGWEEQGAFPAPEGRGSPASLQDRLHSLGEAERLLDELTREKMQVGGVECDRPAHQSRARRIVLFIFIPSSLIGPRVCVQIEAALSQLPRGGGKGSLQARLDEVRGCSRSELYLPHAAVGIQLVSSSGGLREPTGASDP